MIIRAGALEESSKNFSRRSLTVPKIVAQCRKYPIPYLNTLRDHSISLYNTEDTILIHFRPILKHCRTIPYFNTLSRSIPHLINTLSRTIPYLNTLIRTIPYLKALNRIHSDSESSANQNRVLRHPSRVLRHPRALG